VRSFKSKTPAPACINQAFSLLRFSQAMENKRVEGTRASLQTPPLKLQWKIFELLDYPSALFLSATCNSIISFRWTPLMFQKSGAREAFINLAQKFPQHNKGGGFAPFPWGAGYQRLEEVEVEWPPTCAVCGRKDTFNRFRMVSRKPRWTCQTCRRFDWCWY
jgi:hypothetical protein